MSHSPDFRYEQQRDEKLESLIAKAEAGKQFPSSLQYILKDGTLYRKVLMDGEDKLLLVVPKYLRHDILYACHDNPTSGHLGFWRTYQRTRTRYYWPRLLEHVRKYVRGCKHCQMRKIPREKPAGLIEAIAVGQAFEMVGIDVFGPLPKSSKGNQYIIVCTDYFTKFVETRALPAQTSNAVANFIVEQIILRHGAPSRMLSDQSTPFLFDLTQTVLDICQVRHLNTTAYHPQCNGLTEAFNKVLAVMLTMYVNDNHKDWDVYLPFVTSVYNTSKQATTNYTPFYMLHGRECRSVLDTQLGALPENKPSNVHEYTKALVKKIRLAHQIARDNILKVQSGYVLTGNDRRVNREYKLGDLVLLYTPVTEVGLSPELTCHYFGPYCVITRKSKLNYEIESVRSKARGKNTMTVHVKRLKPFYQPLTEMELTADFDSQWRVPIAEVDQELREELEKNDVIPTPVIPKKTTRKEDEDNNDMDPDMFQTRRLRSRTIRL